MLAKQNPITASRRDTVCLEMSAAQASEIQRRLVGVFNYNPAKPKVFTAGLETPGGIAWLMDALHEVTDA